MYVYLNHPENSIIIPGPVFEALGKPSHVQFLTDPNDIIAIKAATADTEESFDIPPEVYSGALFALHDDYFTKLFQKKYGWDNNLRKAEAFLFDNLLPELIVLVDVKGSVPTASLQERLVYPSDFDDDEGIDDDEE